MSAVKSLTAIRYAGHYKEPWNQAVHSAKNGLFTFKRSYLEYHSDRFEDFSFFVVQDDKPVALFPASISSDGNVNSHGGLTFGGLVVARSLRTERSIECFELLLDAIREAGGTHLLIKPVPAAFCNYPAGEIDYALWRSDFKLTRRDLSSLLPLKDPIEFNTLRRRSVKKAERKGLAIRPAFVEDIFPLIAEVLESRHGVAPAHTMPELKYLHDAHTDNILIRCAFDGPVPQAGAVIFVYGGIWHTQYLASSASGREAGALDFVVRSVIDEARSRGAHAVSFGASTEQQGTFINSGLLGQKEGFGARSVVHDFYSSDL